jgi:hypothetical protein
VLPIGLQTAPRQAVLPIGLRQALLRTGPLQEPAPPLRGRAARPGHLLRRPTARERQQEPRQARLPTAEHRSLPMTRVRMA